MKFVDGRPGVVCLNHSWGGEWSTKTKYSGAASTGKLKSKTGGGEELGDGKGISVAVSPNCTGEPLLRSCSLNSPSGGSHSPGFLATPLHRHKHQNASELT